MTSGRAYAIRLALVVFIFVVVTPPALAALAFFSVEVARDAGDLVWGFMIVVAIVLLWVPGFAVALWLTVYPRTRTIGLPFWMPLLVLILLAAD